MQLEREVRINNNDNIYFVLNWCKQPGEMELNGGKTAKAQRFDEKVESAESLNLWEIELDWVMESLQFFIVSNSLQT